MRLHLVDGTFELFRAHYAKTPDEIAPDGTPVKATVGVVRSTLALLRDPDEAVTHIAMAFDNPIESFRNELYPGYKTGEGIEPELRNQFDAVEQAVRALGVVVWSMDRWEADDALATGAWRWSDDVEQVRILTPDKDLGQCVQGDHIVQVDRIRRRVINEAAVREARGVGPESIPDFLALVGDSADGFPGLPRFGAKTAAALLSRYVHLEDIPRDLSAWEGIRGAAGLLETLNERFDDALLFRELATLVADVPLEESLDDLRWNGVPAEAFNEWCAAMGQEALRSRPHRWAT